MTIMKNTEKEGDEIEDEEESSNTIEEFSNSEDVESDMEEEFYCYDN